MSTLRNMILSFLDSPLHTDWDQHLGFLQLAHNSSVHAQTGYSLFFLVHGREARTSADLNLTLSLVNPDNYRHLLLSNLQKTFQVVQAESLSSQATNYLTSN